MADEYDVFLSHNGAHKIAVEEIAVRLVDEAGPRPFLDQSELAPGEQWIPALEHGIQSKTVAVFGPAGVGAWQAQEALALVRSAHEEKRRVIPVLLPGREASAVGVPEAAKLHRSGRGRRLHQAGGVVGGSRRSCSRRSSRGRTWRGGWVLARVPGAHRLSRTSVAATRHTAFFGRDEVLEEIDAWLESGRTAAA